MLTKHSLYWTSFIKKILHIRWTTSENEITFWKKWPSHLRVNRTLCVEMYNIVKPWSFFVSSMTITSFRLLLIVFLSPFFSVKSQKSSTIDEAASKLQACYWGYMDRIEATDSWVCVIFCEGGPHECVIMCEFWSHQCVIKWECGSHEWCGKNPHTLYSTHLIQSGVIITRSNIISYPLFASADTGIYPHAASQYHAWPSACDIMMLRVDKFPYLQKQTRGNQFIPCWNDVWHILKHFCSFKIAAFLFYLA